MYECEIYFICKWEASNFKEGKMGNFRELRVWQRAKDLAVFIYKTTTKGEFSKDFGLRDQIRRAGVSIASNIAEGDE